jgi:UDP-glucose 4-epimerase
VTAERVVVTGATGHLGRYVVHALLARGFSVVAVSRSGALPQAPFGERLSGDLRAVAADLEQDGAVDILREALSPSAALVHLAAWHPPATASTSPQDRRRLLSVNVLGTMRALEAARGGRASVVVYASTFEVYGVPQSSGPISELARVEPVSDYGATKLAGEDHLLAFAYEEKTRVVALRLPAIYGPGEITSRALPNFLERAGRGEVPCIFGTGNDLRDQIHARDAALAVEQALTSQASGIFNVADGRAHSIEELAATAMRVAGLAGEPRRAAAQKATYDFHMNIENARRELLFEPRVELEAGMREQLAWLRARAVP